MLAPEGVFENSDVSGAFCGFAGKKSAAVLWLNAESLEEIPINHDTGERLRLAVTGKRISTDAVKRHIGCGLIERAILFRVCVVDVDLVGARRHASDAAIRLEPGELLRVGEGKWAKEKR